MVGPGELGEGGERLDVHALEDAGRDRPCDEDGHEVALVLAQDGDGDVEAERVAHGLDDGRE